MMTPTPVTKRARDRCQPDCCDSIRRPDAGPGRVILAWAFAGMAVAALVGAALLADLAGQSTTKTLFDESGFLVFAIIGAAIVSRRPGNAVGWVMIGAGTSFTGTAFANHYAMAAQSGGAALPGAVWQPGWGAGCGAPGGGSLSAGSRCCSRTGSCRAGVGVPCCG